MFSRPKKLSSTLKYKNTILSNHQSEILKTCEKILLKSQEFVTSKITCLEHAASFFIHIADSLSPSYHSDITKRFIKTATNSTRLHSFQTQADIFIAEHINKYIAMNSILQTSIKSDLLPSIKTVIYEYNNKQKRNLEEALQSLKQTNLIIKTLSKKRVAAESLFEEFTSGAVEAEKKHLKKHSVSRLEELNVNQQDSVATAVQKKASSFHKKLEKLGNEYIGCLEATNKQIETLYDKLTEIAQFCVYLKQEEKNRMEKAQALFGELSSSMSSLMSEINFQMPEEEIKLRGVDFNNIFEENGLLKERVFLEFDLSYNPTIIYNLSTKKEIEEYLQSAHEQDEALFESIKQSSYFKNTKELEEAANGLTDRRSMSVASEEHTLSNRDSKEDDLDNHSLEKRFTDATIAYRKSSKIREPVSNIDHKVIERAVIKRKNRQSKFTK